MFYVTRTVLVASANFAKSSQERQQTAQQHHHKVFFVHTDPWASIALYPHIHNVSVSLLHTPSLLPHLAGSRQAR